MYHTQWARTRPLHAWEHALEARVYMYSMHLRLCKQFILIALSLSMRDSRAIISCLTGTSISKPGLPVMP